MRPEELFELKGYSKISRGALKWKPEYTFESMLDEMIYHWETKIQLGKNFEKSDKSLKKS